VYTPTLKKHQVVRDLKKFENHWFKRNKDKHHFDRRSGQDVMELVEQQQLPQPLKDLGGITESRLARVSLEQCKARDRFHVVQQNFAFSVLLLYLK